MTGVTDRIDEARLRRFRPYPAYRDSGVEWLGEVPEHWVTCKATHGFRRIGSGTTPKSDDPEYYDGDISWVTTSELRETVIVDTTKKVTATAMREYPTLRMYPKGTLLFAMYGATIGRLGILGIAATVNQACAALAEPLHLATWFVYYWLQMRRPTLTVLSAGGGQPNLSQDDLRQLRIPAPPLDEQRAIAAFLDRETAKIDGLLASKERLIELLQEKRAALITRAVTRGLDPNVPMKDFGVEWLGEIPAHWEVRRIAMAVNKITNGYVGPTRDILVDDGVPYLQSLHIKNGQIDFDRKHYFVTKYWSNQHRKSILRTGDVLVVQTGDIGQNCVVPGAFEGVNCHALIILRLKPHLGEGAFLSLLLQSSYGQNALKWSQTGALHPHLECGHVREIPLVLPPPEEQRLIMREVEVQLQALDSLLAKVRQAIQHLKEFRTALISAAVTGKIDVREEAS